MTTLCNLITIIFICIALTVKRNWNNLIKEAE